MDRERLTHFELLDQVERTERAERAGAASARSARQPCCDLLDGDALGPMRAAVVAITYTLWAAVAAGLLGLATWLLVRLILEA